MPDAGLYETDFFLWTREQAEALRARRFGANEIDFDRVAEEIEDLGSEQRNAVESYATRIVEHLYKLHGTRNPHPVGHWQREIEVFREELRKRETASIRRTVSAQLEAVHLKAARWAQLDFKSDEPDAEIDGELRWSWLEITGVASPDPAFRTFPLDRTV